MSELEQEITQEPANAPGRVAVPVEGREGSDAASGSNAFISWGARSDVGLVRGHNEDSFLLRTPLFAVCDGMGGHAAGEVASSIAVETIGEKAPATADDVQLGAAVEAANVAVIKGAEEGRGKPGMGCTASAVIIDGNKMSVAHVGDSRVYLLHHGTLVRITHDHSFVEELVDAGEITADEARVHPSRSVITRALGSDPDMYADHFSLEVSTGDRVIVCSDGLSSMVEDSEIELLAVSSVTPQAAADNLVSAALTAGGADNVTVVVIDILSDGVAERARRDIARKLLLGAGIVTLILAVVVAGMVAFIKGEWYVAANGDTLGIYQGVNGSFLGFELSELVETTSVQVKDLPQAVQTQVETGIQFASEADARAAVEAYRDQIDADKTRAAEAAEAARAEGEPTGETIEPEGEVPGESAAGSVDAAEPDETVEAEAEAAEGGE